jgi:DNA-binding response OmpR family regulator
MKKKKILLVDDEEDIVMLTAEALKYEGYDVVTAFNGEEALAKADAEKPDLAIVDLMLPLLSGSEVVRRLKENSAHKDMPIIVITALSQQDDPALIRGASADFFMVKPFDPGQLLSKIKELLTPAP